MERACLYCGEVLPRSENLGAQRRVAFDPHLGRLWVVCTSCDRWNLAPFESRWEVIETCEERARQAQVLIRTEHLALLADPDGHLIRVGAPGRVELADWRYSARLFGLPGSRIERMLAALPEWPAGGYDFYGTARRLPDAWIGSPFIDDAAYLAPLFLAVPLARWCPSCEAPLFIHPAAFGDIRLQHVRRAAMVRAPCGLCGAEVVVPLSTARPALRAGLALVSRHLRQPDQVRRAVIPLERAGGSREVLRRLCRRRTSIGQLPPKGRLALWIVLDELAEAEALEEEWRSAEELARISDAELTNVPGFEDFRRRAAAAGQT